MAKQCIVNKDNNGETSTLMVPNPNLKTNEQNRNDTRILSTVAGKRQAGEILEGASNIIGTEANRTQKKIWEKEIESWARENNHWLEIDSLGEYMTQGAENLVFDYSESSVVKVNFDLEQDFEDFKTKITTFNTLFPHTGYEVIGFTRLDRDYTSSVGSAFGKGMKGDFAVVMKQNYVPSKVEITTSEITEYMTSLGFEATQDPTVFIKDGITVSDLHLDNVLKTEDGTYHVIDGDVEVEDDFQFEIEEPPLVIPADIDARIQESKDNIERINREEEDKSKLGKDAFTDEWYNNVTAETDNLKTLELLKQGRIKDYEHLQEIKQELDDLNKPFLREVGNDFYPLQGTVIKGEKIRENEDLGGIYEADVVGYLYRGVSMEDYNRILETGFIDTDMRGVISDQEGINLATRAGTGFNYLPSDQEGVVMAIKVSNKEALFMIGADDYVRSSEPIPVSDIEFITTPSINGIFTLVKNNTVTPLKIETFEQKEFIPSQLFDELSAQPFVTKEQALEMYKNIYSEELNYWKNAEMNCK